MTMSYKPHSLVFDLDETLINTHFLKLNEVRDVMSSNLKKNISSLDRETYQVIFSRPYLNEFLDYCFNNFNIGVWTAGNAAYCRDVIKAIFTNKQIEKLNFALARKGDQKSIDILTNKNFHHPILYRGRHTKPLNVLWNDELIGRKYNQYNTIIIDNNTDVTNISPRNSVNIDDFEYPDEIDNSLYKLKKWLKKIVLYKDLRKVKKPIFNPCGYELPRVNIDDNNNLLLDSPTVPIKRIKIKKKSSLSKKNKRKIKRNIKP